MNTPTQATPHTEVRTTTPRTTIRSGIGSMTKGLPIVGIALAELVLLCLFLVAVALIGAGVGLLLVPPLAMALRSVVNVSRRTAGRWGGITIPEPYRPAPTTQPGFKGSWQRTHWVLTDPATWRDLAWTAISPVAGAALALLPTALVVGGLGGLLMPALYRPIAATGENYYLWIQISDLSSAWQCAALGLVTLLAGLVTGPPTQRAHATLARKLLTPARATSGSGRGR